MIEIHSCRITYVFLKKLFVACFFGMSFSIPVFAEDYGMHNYESSQQKQAQTKKSIMVKGKVVDEQGEPLPGVNIVVAGGTRGVATDLDGSFTIAVLPTDALQVSYLGMEDMTVAIKGRTELIITMRTKPDELDEVTVLHLPSRKKKALLHRFLL